MEMFLVFILAHVMGFGWGIFFCIWLGMRAEKKGPQTNYHYKDTKLCENHTWCPEHAAKGFYHCTVCPYTLDKAA